MDKDYWKVTDSTGREHGTFDRETASDVLDKIWRDNPALGWVEMTEVQPSETIH